MATKLCATIEDENQWVTGLAQQPVFIDGLTSELFYLIVASKAGDAYRAVVIGKFNPDYFKVKFYGSFEEWGFNWPSLVDKFGAHEGTMLSRKNGAGYERYMTNRRGVAQLLKALSETRGVTVCPIEGFEAAYDLPMPVRRDIRDLLQPVSGGRRPQLPFKAPTLLAAPQAV